jgi:hypothetical protein
MGRKYTAFSLRSSRGHLLLVGESPQIAGAHGSQGALLIGVLLSDLPCLSRATM